MLRLWPHINTLGANFRLFDFERNDFIIQVLISILVESYISMAAQDCQGNLASGNADRHHFDTTMD
jgi:hypothetical protein